MRLTRTKEGTSLFLRLRGLAHNTFYGVSVAHNISTWIILIYVENQGLILASYFSLLSNILLQRLMNDYPNISQLHYLLPIFIVTALLWTLITSLIYIRTRGVVHKSCAQVGWGRSLSPACTLSYIGLLGGCLIHNLGSLVPNLSPACQPGLTALPCQLDL